MKPSIVWFRSDLRVEDNPSLDAAIRKGSPIIPLYIWAPDDEGSWPPGAASRWWLHYSLLSLKRQLGEIGLTLIIRTGNTIQVLNEIIQETDADSIFWNARYEPAALSIEKKIAQRFMQENINLHRFHGNLLFDPQNLLNKQGRPFQVFTPFWKHCLTLQEPSAPSFLPKSINAFTTIKSVTVESLDLLPHIHWDAGLRAAWRPGTLEAKKILSHFLKHALENYHEARDRADLTGISHLSPYLHFGEISPHTVWHAVKKYSNVGAEYFLRQLGWREFAHSLLFHFPFTPDRPLRENFNTFPWREDPVALKAWHKGMTGYPLVDAGMRELWTTGWMHNRIRMVVGSFLVKDLRLSWNEGAKWFWDTLVDADLANNTLGWQWVGGCGADAAPYFRIFNPVTQAEKADPTGDYVRKWIPELAKLPDRWLHSPWEAPEDVLRKAGVSLGVTYPRPVVDHDVARKEALEAFKSNKGI